MIAQEIRKSSGVSPLKWISYVILTAVLGMITYLCTTKSTTFDVSRVEEVAEESTAFRIALGTNQDLNDFAEKVGALPYKDWGSFQPQSTTGSAYAQSIVAMAEAFPNLTFHFNLTDAKTGNRIDQTYEKFPTAITSTEFKVIFMLYKERTTFYIKSGSIYKPIQIK